MTTLAMLLFLIWALRNLKWVPGPVRKNKFCRLTFPQKPIMGLSSILTIMQATWEQIFSLSQLLFKLLKWIVYFLF